MTKYTLPFFAFLLLSLAGCGDDSKSAVDDLVASSNRFAEAACECAKSLGATCDDIEGATAPNACEKRVLDEHADEVRASLTCLRSAMDDLTDCYANQCRTAEQVSACLLDASDIEECPELPASVTNALAECE